MRASLCVLAASAAFLGACSSMGGSSGSSSSGSTGYGYGGGGMTGTTASRTAAPAMAMDGVLVGPSQMTLYVFDRDTAGAGKSACNGPCATNWPPLMATDAAAASGDWTVVTRDDGAKQWAYKGRPLYYWSKDSKPGERTGDGFNNVWHTARP